jgi:hypothetical protein
MNSRSSEAATNRAIVADFESGRAPGDFRHADHVRVAFAYLAELPLAEAIARFSSALQHFAAAQGKPGRYHETMTWAYMLLIHERRSRDASGESWEAFAARNPDLLEPNRALLERYYSRSVLDSDLARKCFVLPDRVAGSEPETCL